MLIITIALIRDASNWKSILVQTGIHKAGDVPEHFHDIRDAVQWGISQQGVEMGYDWLETIKAEERLPKVGK